MDKRKKSASKVRVPTGKRPSRVYSFRLPAEIADIWDAKIDQSGYVISEFMREAVIANKTIVTPAKRGKVQRKDLSTQSEREILYLLQRQGANVNQLAHAVNLAKKEGSTSEQMFVAVLEELQKIEAQANVLMSQVFPL
jgi:predicted transcriptional regulator